MIRYALITPPAAEPVSAAELRTHARLDDNGDDATLNALIAAARTLVERATGRALITQTWTAQLDAWPDIDEDDGRRYVRLSPAPAASITSVSVDGAALSASLYGRRGDDLVVSGDATDASTDFGQAGILITFVSGYGAAGTNVPADLLLAVKMTAAHLYENRELQELPTGALPLIAPYRVLRGL